MKSTIRISEICRNYDRKTFKNRLNVLKSSVKFPSRKAHGLFISFIIAGAMLTAGCNSNRLERWKVIREDLHGLPGSMWQDSKDLVGQKENLAILLAAGGVSGYVRCAQDDGIANHFENQHTFSRDFTIAQGAIPLAELSLSGAGYLFGVLAEDDEIYQVARTMMEAQALNGLYTGTLKLIAQDYGPNGEKLAWPSGHTSVSVTFATVMNEYYGPWVGLPLYALSGFVMYERMETAEHWASDLIFGAAVGYTVGKTVAGKYKPEGFGMNVLPYVDPQTGGTGIMLTKQF